MSDQQSAGAGAASEEADFVITGHINAQEGPAVGVSVQAFQKGLPSLGAGGERRLGERALTDTAGFYEIRFQSGALGAARGAIAKPFLDVFVRVYDGTAPVADSPVQFGAAFPAVIDLAIALPPLSEYETQLRLIRPLLDGVSVAELSDDDLLFLRQQVVSRNSGSPRLSALADGVSRLALVRQAAVQSRASNLPAELLYGLKRILGDETPAELARLDPSTLSGAITESIAQRILSPSLAPRVDDLVRQIQRVGYVSHSAQLRLLDSASGSPVVGLAVRAISADDPVTARLSGASVSDANGTVAFEYLAPPGSEGAPLRFGLTLSKNGGNDPFQQAVTLIPSQASATPIDVSVSPPAPPAAPAIHIDSVAATLPAAIPPELRQFLSDRGLTTLSAIRAAGGLARAPGLPVAADSPAVRTLDAHVDLGRLSSDVATNAALIDKGFLSVTAVADASLPTFRAATAGVLDAAQAARVHQVARAQTAFLDNLLADAVTNPRAAAGLLPADFVRPQSCTCEDCESAISPGFYLADLINYATSSLQQNGPVDLQFLVDTFHQPFDGLPISCEGVERQVHCARICIEVLRAHLGARPLLDPVREAALQTAERDYLTKAYTTLLLQVGTTYEELRLARAESDETKRQALASRLGIALTTPRPASGDELDRLLIDITTGASGPNGIERNLEQLFGLADTFRDPLSDGAKLGDEATSALVRWSLRGAEWGRNTDQDGFAYVKIQGREGGSAASIAVYRDRQQTQVVASNDAPSPSPDVVLPAPGSGLSGTLEAVSPSASATAQLSLIPNLLSWRLRQLRTLWASEDRPEDQF